MDKLKMLRLAYGLTQKDLAEKLNLKKAAISKYENGSVKPGCDILKKLSKVFEVSIDYLLDNEPYATSNHYPLTIEQVDFLKAFDSLNADSKRVLQVWLNFLLKNQSENVPRSISQNNNNSGNIIVSGNNGFHNVINVGSNNLATGI